MHAENFDRDVVKQVAIISFMDSVGTGSDLLSCRRFFPRNTPAVRGGDSSGCRHDSEDGLLVTVCYAIYVDAAGATDAPRHTD